MNYDDLEVVISTILRRGAPAYTTPSGAFLEHLRVLAQRLDLSAFAEACALYTSAHRDTASFIAAGVPGILCNNYFTVLPGFDYEKFICWAVANPDWGSRFKDTFTTASALESAVSSVRSEVAAYA